MRKLIFLICITFSIITFVSCTQKSPREKAVELAERMDKILNNESDEPIEDLTEEQIKYYDGLNSEDRKVFDRTYTKTSTDLMLERHNHRIYGR